MTSRTSTAALRIAWGAIVLGLQVAGWIVAALEGR